MFGWFHSGCWFLTSSVPVGRWSACEAGQPRDWCRLPPAYGSLDRQTASTILTATAVVRQQDICFVFCFFYSLQGSITNIQTLYIKIYMLIQPDIYPVVCFACLSLQAFLQPFPHTTLEELLHQFTGVFQLLLAHDGLQGSQVSLACLLQGWHRQFR